MSIVLDTSALYYPRALRALRGRAQAIIVPALVLAERARQLHRDRGLDPQDFLAGLLRHGFIVEPSGPSEVLRYAPFLDDTAWRRHSADALIAGHVRDGDELWTANPKDFRALGVEHVVDATAF